MSKPRACLVPAVLVLLSVSELAWAQYPPMFSPRAGYQQMFMQPGRRPLSAAPARLDLSAACLDYGIKTPGPEDVFPSVSAGHAFLIGGLPNGGQERLDLSEAVTKGWVVLRGTGKDNAVRVEVLAPGWSELEIRPGFQALPPGATAAEIPKTTLTLVKQAAALEEGFEKRPADAGALLGRILARARQEHLWAIRSTSWQTLNAGLDPLPAALDRLSAVNHDPTAKARMDWILRHTFALAFLGDYTVLRVDETPAQGAATLEICTQHGVQRFPLTRAGLRELKPPMMGGQTAHVLLTSELLKALDRAGLASTLDGVLADAGNSSAWCVPDDSLLVQSFETPPAFRRRFAVIAPQNNAEAKALFGSSKRAAFAFKGLIDEGRIERVKNAADLRHLAAQPRAGERLVLVCMQQHGQIPLPDGSQLSLEDLPAGVAEVIACDAFDPTGKPPMEPLQPGAFTFDALAEGISAVRGAGDDDKLVQAQLLERLSAGLSAHWKRQNIGTGPVLKWARTLRGDTVAVGASGTVLKIMTRAAPPAQQATR